MFGKDSPVRSMRLLRSPPSLSDVLRGCGNGYRIDRAPAAPAAPRTPVAEDLPPTEHRKLAPGSQQSLSLLGPMLSQRALSFDAKPNGGARSVLLGGLARGALLLLCACVLGFTLVVLFGEPVHFAHPI